MAGGAPLHGYSVCETVNSLSEALRICERTMYSMWSRDRQITRSYDHYDPDFQITLSKPLLPWKMINEILPDQSVNVGGILLIQT